MKTRKYIGLATLLTLFSGCSSEDYPLYDTNQKDAVFFDYMNADNTSDTSVNYTFNYNIADSYEVEIPVVLMGMPSERDRTFKVVPIDRPSNDTDTVGDEQILNMKEGVHFTLGEAILPAHATKTSFKVTLLRNNDPELLSHRFGVRLKIEENDDLRPTGQSTFDIVFSDIRPQDTPSWWPSYSPLPKYSFEAAQLFFEYYYTYAEEGNKDTFDEMNTRYGEYFMNAQSSQGPFAMYSTFLIRYVLIPMYADHADDFEWQSIPQLI